MKQPAEVVNIAHTLQRLGVRNVMRVAIYRALLATGWRPRPLEKPCPPGPIFGHGNPEHLPAPAEQRLFGWYAHLVEELPDWHADPFEPAFRMDSTQDWSASLAALEGGDPKLYWEMSRFYWVPQFALAAREGDSAVEARLDAWLVDWIRCNPPHQGINWACGQEAAIRVMNLTLAAVILDSWRSPSSALIWLIEAHVHRIAPTLFYALGQDNNHGSAEACALYLAGTWGRHWGMPGARSLARRGRRWLANRALRLIQSDGSPTQYSVTYHRANLETLALAELWAQRTGAPSLPERARARAALGARWLHRLVDAASGDAPNLGANDGSHLFSVPRRPYRDFRPTVALAAWVFEGARAWPEQTDARFAALNINPGQARVWAAPESANNDAGGLHVLRKGKALAVLRYPRFRFRPSQADVLHLDLWANGQNVLRDAGTYSYNTTAEWMDYFGGVAGHNTVQFDGRDQMPRLSRFLFGGWLRTERLYPLNDDGVQVTGGASYRDAQDARHCRRVTLSDSALQVQDDVEGFVRSAVLRWRLLPGDWSLSASPSAADRAFELTGPDGLRMRLKSSVPIVRCVLTQGWESRYYLQKTPVPVVELEIGTPGSMTSYMTWPA